MKGTRIVARRKGSVLGNINVFLLCLMAFITVYPFLYLAATSVSSSGALSRGEVYLFPVGWDTSAYIKVFKDIEFMRSYLNTIIYALLHVMVGVTCEMMMAYPLAMRGDFTRYSNVIMKFVLITMYFSGGLIPSYLVVRSAGLLNTFWAMIIPGAVSSYHLILARTFIRELPDDLFDASYIDGANEVQIFLRIIIPLSMPIVAVLILYRAVGAWNDYFGPLLYLSDPQKYTLQIYLRDLLASASMETYRETNMDFTKETFSTVQVRSCALVVATLPILIAYPFLQKYFVKGMMIGAIKG